MMANRLPAIGTAAVSGMSLLPKALLGVHPSAAGGEGEGRVLWTGTGRAGCGPNWSITWRCRVHSTPPR
jgi:hypothetical protein